jgi:hypothetical protein
VDDCKPLRDGTRARAEFGFNGDVLVLMLGDGVVGRCNLTLPNPRRKRLELGA